MRPRFKDYILPLVFLKRLGCLRRRSCPPRRGLGDPATTEKLVEGDHKLVRFYVPPVARWELLAIKTTDWSLTDAVRARPREPSPPGRNDVVDFNGSALLYLRREWNPPV